MGKKRKSVAYDEKAMENLAVYINRARQPLKDVSIPRLRIDMKALEDTVKGLPKKEKEVMEKFWGLIPGTPIRANNVLQRIGKDMSLKNMMDEAYEIVRKLISVEYLYLYDMGVRKLVENIMTKIDKRNCEDISDIDAIKYFIIFLVFLSGGHQMVYETDGSRPMTEEEENKGCFDKYALLKATWDCTTKNLPDHSISLKLIILFLEMLDIKDVITMRRYVFLPIDREYEDMETDPIGTFKQLRLFKEKIFHSGPWNMAFLLIYGNNVEKAELEKLGKHFGEFRSDWNNLNKYRKDDAVITTSKGEVTLPLYRVEEFEFTDSYEVMFFYVNRNYLL